MLDESMFEEIHEIAETSAYLKAVEEKDVSLEMLKQLPPYEELKELEEKLRVDNKINFDTIFREPTGYYMIKCFLIADYAVDKAIFIKDVEAYRSMRFESARRRIAMLLYQRFVAPDCEQMEQFKKGSSVFEIIQQRKNGHDPKDEKMVLMANDGVAGMSATQSAPMSGYDLMDRKEMSQRSSNARSSIASNSGIESKASKDSKDKDKDRDNQRPELKLQIGTGNNAIGVYGKQLAMIKKRIQSGDASKDLFDAVSTEVLNDLKLDIFPRFLQSEFFKKYIRTK